MSKNIKNHFNEEQSQNYPKHKNAFFSDLSDLPYLLLDWIENNANDVVGVWNEEGQLQYISENVKQVYGYDPSDLLFNKWRNKLTAEEFICFVETISINTNHQSMNLNIRHHNGNLILSNVLIDKIQEIKSESTYFMSIIQDISDKIEMQNIVNGSQATSLTGQVAASIAHEIRNPLTSLKGFLQLLQSGVREKEVYYKIMIDEIDKIEMITSDLLLISKPLAKEKKPESIYPLLHDVIVLLNSQAQQRNIKVILPEFQKLVIKCDKTQLKQVFINIIKNAIEASEPSGKVLIKLTRVKSNIHIAIIDEGPGIPDDILQKINEPFFTTKATGTGLGLMISQQILKQHSGELSILTNKVKGSTFTIILPYRDVEV